MLAYSLTVPCLCTIGQRSYGLKSWAHVTGETRRTHERLARHGIGQQAAIDRGVGGGAAVRVTAPVNRVADEWAFG
jgi:hypothetical protein